MFVFDQIATAQFKSVLPSTDSILRTSLKVSLRGFGEIV